jgi:hypothetical protein
MVWIVGIGLGLVLLFVFPKQMGALLLLLVFGGLGLFAFIYSADQRRADEDRRRRETIFLSAEFNVARCTAEFPILVTIRNGYTQTIRTLNFNLFGFREGFSTPVYRGSSYSSDRIIRPGGSYEACWSLPYLQSGAQNVQPAGLLWRASYSYATFGNGP